MGILNEKDIYSPKFVTAEISDAENQIHFVPIKHTLGDYFLAEIDQKLYAFSLKNARHLKYRKTFAKSFEVIQYDTSHTESLKPEADLLRKMLIQNKLPKVDRTLFDVLRVIGRREQRVPMKVLLNDDGEPVIDEEGNPIRIEDPEYDGKFAEQSIPELIDEFVERAGPEYQKDVKHIIQYLSELGINKIVTPVQKVTDYLQGDFIATNPSFIAEGIPHYMRLDEEHKRITNTEIKGTRNLGKIMLIVMAVVIVAALVFIAYDQGWLDFAVNIADNVGTIQEGFQGIPSVGIPQTGGAGKGDYSDASIQSRYTPESLKVAIENGEIEYDKLSSNMKNLVGDVKVPQVAPVP